jgi:F-box protein 9
MDDGVDLKYRNKHFSKRWAQKPNAVPNAVASGSSAPVAGTAAGTGTPDAQPQSMKELITSFAGLAITPATPEIKGTPAPPCPIAVLPEEILVHILRDVALLDVGDFVRLSQVCKRFAFLVATENRIWRRICLGPEFGFGGMHYHWQKQVSGEDLTTEDLLQEIEAAEDEDIPPLTLQERAEQHAKESLENTIAVFSSLYGSSWQRMFRLRPRIRFNGCYISTVNYIRAGQASIHSVTWNSPVHIVTYYRYLRFSRDGTVISLLTTSEPADVVHHLTREALVLHANGANAHLPSIVMQTGLKGRWRLGNAADNPDADIGEIEGDLVVETEGVRNYMYRMDLSLRSAGKGAKNNKLVWRGFYSYNRLTDDWAEFGLKNDKAFFFSRVKSYGTGS